MATNAMRPTTQPVEQYEAPLLSFSPRASKLSIYLMDGHTGRENLLEQLGPHSIGMACLDVTRLERVD